MSFNFKNGNRSLNYWTPKDKCTVKYNDLDHAVWNCLKLDKLFRVGSIFFSRTDFRSAFRVLPIKIYEIKWLVMKAEDPITGEVCYFVDKNLPFGSSVSCSHFQRVSNCFKHLLEWKSGRKHIVTNYLDDFLFIETTEIRCNAMVRMFLIICEEINFPVAEEKTVLASTTMEFLGMVLNGVHRLIQIPEEKRIRTVSLLNLFIAKKKVTVHEIQQLTGLLNFLNKAIVPGRAFMRRMYSKYAGIGEGRTTMKRYHHVYLDKEFRQDCDTWLTFLSTKITLAVSRPFLDRSETRQAEVLEFYTDASKNKFFGVGCVFMNEWSFSQWERGYIEKCDPSIAYLELLGLCTGIYIWAEKLANLRVVVQCDNTSVRDMVNAGASASGCKNCMYLLRLLTLINLRYNTRVFVQYIETKKNSLADSLSRMDFKKFFDLAPDSMSPLPESLPEELWPNDIYLHYIINTYPL